jgi:hypothetical protein
MSNSLNNLIDYFDSNNLPLLPIGAILIAIGLALALAMPPAEATPAAQDAIYIIATPAAAPQVAPTQPAGLPRAVVAYAAPDGVALGAVEAGRVYAQLARSGTEWVLLDVAGSGRVWVRSAELAGVAAGLPDMATPVPPPPQPHVVIVEHPAPAPPQIVHYSKLSQPVLTQAEQAAAMRLHDQARALQQQLYKQQQAVPTATPADGWGSLGGGSGGSWGD